MAVSKHKSSNFSGSLSCGSAEDVDHFCDPCNTTGKQVDAQKYCVECGEYLCRKCSDYHLRTKASRNHRLIEKDKVGELPTKQDSEVCTEKCPEHKQEVIKYFCPRHESLCCHDCIIMHHRTCEVDYIPDKCADIANSEEYKRTVHKLDLKLQELSEITNTIKVRNHKIHECHHNLLQEIIKFRKQINDHLDRLQQKLQKEADKKKTEDKQIIKTMLDGCKRLSLDIKEMQSALQVNETSGKYGPLYIMVKQAQSVLKSDEIKVKDGLEKTAKQYILKCNSSLAKMLSMQDTFGKLSLTSVLKPQRSNMKNFHTLTRKDNSCINIRTKSDKNDCWITGCAVLSPDKLIIADPNNYKLKLVDIFTKSVVEETSFDSQPWNVAVLSEDQIAVTMPDKRQVVIMAYDDRLSTVNTVSVKGECRGISSHHGQLYVVCVDSLRVLILDKQGNVQNKISLNKEIFSIPDYLVVSKDSNLLYISDCGKHCVVSITLQGEVTAVYKHKDLVRPLGMLILDDGSLVACFLNGSIHRISSDLKQSQPVIDGVMSSNSICYNHHLHEVYIGRLCDSLTVLIPQ